jgi:hypothetical protein
MKKGDTQQLFRKRNRRRFSTRAVWKVHRTCPTCSASLDVLILPAEKGVPIPEGLPNNSAKAGAGRNGCAGRKSLRPTSFRFCRMAITSTGHGTGPTLIRNESRYLSEPATLRGLTAEQIARPQEIRHAFRILLLPTAASFLYGDYEPSLAPS